MTKAMTVKKRRVKPVECTATWWQSYAEKRCLHARLVLFALIDGHYTPSEKENLEVWAAREQGITALIFTKIVIPVGAAT